MTPRVEELIRFREQKSDDFAKARAAKFARHRGLIRGQHVERQKNADPKTRKVLEELAFEHHPFFKQLPKTQKKRALEYPSLWDAETIAEETIAALSDSYERIDAVGYDFTDYTECKFSSVNPPAKPWYQCSTLHIYSLENKIGDIRAIIYNCYKDTLDYFFIPFRELPHMITRRSEGGKMTKKQQIRSSYNFSRDEYAFLESWRVWDAEALAKMKATVNYN